MIANPIKTIYEIGEELNLKLGYIEAMTAMYNKSKDITVETESEPIEITENMVSGYDKNTIGEQELTVTYAGKTATFYIEVISGKVEVDSEKYDIMVKDEKRYICNIEPKTTLQEMKNNIDTNAEIEIYKGTQKIEDENVKLATGMKLKVYTNSESIEYTIVVTGDLNGDGEMEDIDLLKLARYKAGLDETLQGEYLQAANIYNDDNIADDTDLLKMARILAGLDTL